MAVILRDKKILAAIGLFTLLFLLNAAILVGTNLPALKQAIDPPTVTPTQTPTQTPTPTQTASPIPSASPTINSPTSVGAAIFPDSFSGTVVLSMVDAGYAHLYLYRPGGEALTRITNDPWDDVTPSLSPDGSRVAFSSKRNGYWNIYILSLTDGSLQQVTDTPAFDSSPTWSPDGNYLAYCTKSDQNLEIAIATLNQANVPPIFLTSDSGNSQEPAWSTQGRKIAFISDRTGKSEIWIADLDQTDHRFSQLPFDSFPSPHHPVWSPDGNKIAWSAVEDNTSNIYTWDFNRPEQSPRKIGAGNEFAWNPDGKILLSVSAEPNQSYLEAYDLVTSNYALQPQALMGSINGLDWKAGEFPNSLPQNLAQAGQVSQPATWQMEITPPVENLTERYGVVALTDVSAPYPQLHVQVASSFEALRQRIIQETGWDFFANLENAFLPLTSPSLPGMSQDWLYTGRAISINTVPVNVGWMFVAREDIGMETYWRIYLRPIYQDGSLGSPVGEKPWDFDARFNGDTSAYERGGKVTANVPEGYWVDFTDLALRYGWERQPAMNNWTSFYQGARYNEFVLRSGLDWNSAMLELYPPDILTTPAAYATSTSTPTITPKVIHGKTITPTPTSTTTATPRPTWTPYAPGQTP